jgi:hypothetical protein
MAIPEIKRVEPIGGEKIEILGPELFVVEKREQLGRIRIFVNVPARQDVCLRIRCGSAKFKRGASVKSNLRTAFDSRIPATELKQP